MPGRGLARADQSRREGPGLYSQRGARARASRPKQPGPRRCSPISGMSHRQASGGEQRTQGPSPSPRPCPSCPDGHCLVPIQPCLQPGRPSLEERRCRSTQKGLQRRGGAEPSTQKPRHPPLAHWRTGAIRRGAGKCSRGRLLPPPASHQLAGCTPWRVGALFLLLLKNLPLMGGTKLREKLKLKASKMLGCNSRSESEIFVPSRERKRGGGADEEGLHLPACSAVFIEKLQVPACHPSLFHAARPQFRRPRMVLMSGVANGECRGEEYSTSRCSTGQMWPW